MRSAVLGVMAICVFSALCGCAQIEKRADDRDDRTCLGYGAKPGSDAYIQCRTALLAERRQARHDFVFKD